MKRTLDIGVGDIAELDVSAAESEMVIFDGTDDADYLSEAVATGMLFEHHHKKMVPASESLYVPVASTLLDYSIKYSLGQKIKAYRSKCGLKKKT